MEGQVVEGFLFYLFGGAMAFFTLATIFVRTPVYSAIFMILSFASTAGLFVLLDAYLIAIVQVLVYAGAIMVLFLFVIMLINLRSDELEGLKINPVMVLAAGTFLGLFSKAVADLGPAVSSESNALVGSPGLLAETLFTEYVVPFEAVSLLLLAAILGTVVLSRRSGDG
ncbi:MAG: NADH-quinone oxidoreductase subunit J [Planctomycetota bacterium]|nr:NADH-quinone oxidoreductase subunit J [Planctomycetota bacterium]